MENIYVKSEIDREINMVGSYIKDVSLIYKSGFQTWTNRNTLDDLEQSALRILQFVYHIEALKQVKELPNNLEEI